MSRSSWPQTAHRGRTSTGAGLPIPVSNVCSPKHVDLTPLAPCQRALSLTSSKEPCLSCVMQWRTPMGMQQAWQQACQSIRVLSLGLLTRNPKPPCCGSAFIIPTSAVPTPQEVPAPLASCTGSSDIGHVWGLSRLPARNLDCSMCSSLPSSSSATQQGSPISCGGMLNRDLSCQARQCKPSNAHAGL